MKRTIKFLVVAAFMMSSTALFAQKFGRIDYQGVIFTMPEMTTVQTELEKVQADYQEAIESMQVERNRKVDEVSKLPETTSETTRQLRGREILDIEQRIQEYFQLAQDGINRAQVELMTPVQEKADAAIEKVCKAQGIVGVFHNESMAWLDADQIADITAAVRTELGIPADAVPVMPAMQ
ncbi:MAG: OmpH family outer membrane protein [Alistipes sp.]|jgi:outer membrane protein|nr:OmpH family outer membrane protein [Alistipes sp.]